MALSEPSPAMIERAAEALWREAGLRGTPTTYPYERLIEATKEDLRTYARAVIEALSLEVDRPRFSDDERFEVAAALRDWIHEQPWSECGPGADTCPDWPKAFEIRDIALGALGS